MKKYKLTPLIVISLALIIFSITAAFLFGYYFLYKKEHNITTSPRQSASAFQQTNDAKVNALPDSVKAELIFSKERQELSMLQQDISNLLRQKDDSAGLRLSKEMQFEMEQQIQSLRSRSALIIERNKKLNEELDGLSGNIKILEKQAATSAAKTPTIPLVATPLVAALDTTSKKPIPVTKVEPPKNKIKIVASELRMTALNVAGNRERETSNSTQTQKILCSAWLENVGKGKISKDIVAEILKPGGKVLQRSKVRFEANVGELKRVNFNIAAKDLPSGNYRMQLLYNGEVIGMASKFLQ